MPAIFLVRLVPVAPFGGETGCGPAITAIEKEVVVVPILLAAVTVYIVALCVAVGVPEITPVEEFIDRPAGKPEIV